MPGRLVLLDCSTRVAPGCLTADAWDVLRSADAVLTGTADHPQLPALAHAGVPVEVADAADAELLSTRLVDAARDALVVWLVAPGGDAALTQALSSQLVLAGASIELEHLLGSYDLAGAHVLDLVAVMDRLRSPGGCPWDAEQTHESLVRYLIEEAYEVAEAIETGDRAHLVEELGDVLLQVVFHSRVAAEHPDGLFTVDDVADGIVAKLVRRHPHVFADPRPISALDVEGNWEQLKAAEKGRTSVLDGIPPTLPALMFAEKVLARAQRTGVQLRPAAAGVVGAADAAEPAASPAGIESEEALGAALLDLVARAHRSGLDPEAALRRAIHALVRTTFSAPPG